MAGIRIEAHNVEELEALAHQMGVSITKVYPKRGGYGVMGYGTVQVNNVQTVQVTEEQIEFIAAIFYQYMTLEHARQVFEESQIIDVEFTVKEE